MMRRPPRSTRTDTLFPYTTLFRSAGLLFLEIVGREAEHFQPLPARVLIQLFQPFVLRRQTALRRHVDDQQHLALERSEVGVTAIDALDRDVVERLRHVGSLILAGGRPLSYRSTAGSSGASRESRSRMSPPRSRFAPLPHTHSDEPVARKARSCRKS